MARGAIAATLAAAAVSALSGCGTVLNLTERPVLPDFPHRVEQRSVYGGTQNDFKLGSMLVGTRLTEFPDSESLSDPAGFVLGAGVLLLDLPLSVVGDTLTLPYTLYVNAQRASAASDGPGPPTPGWEYLTTDTQPTSASDAPPGRIATKE